MLNFDLKIPYHREKGGSPSSGENMEILVNRCFGGFGLSRLAIEELRKLCHKPSLDVVLGGEAYGPDTGSEGEIRGEFFDSYEPEDCRTDPVVITVVRRLGEDANGMYANLEIVEIPDGVEWEIDDYDGRESIHEVHRSW